MIPVRGPILPVLAVVLLSPALSGCLVTTVAGAAVDVAKAPFQVAGAGIDMLTTSQSEADRNRGRKERKREEADAKAAKKAEKEQRKAEKAAEQNRY